MADIQGNIIKVDSLVKQLNATFTEHIKVLDKSAEKISQINELYKKTPSAYIKLLKEQETLEKQRISTQKKLTEAQKQNTNEIKSKIPTLRQLATISKQNATANEKLASAWYKLTEQLKKAEKEYRDLAASQGLSNAKTKQAQIEVQKLRAKVDAINTPIKRFGDNVGNYKSALSGVVPLLRSFVSAFGLTSGVYLFANAVRDAFNRVREFDKAMQNIAGIMRTSRSEIKDLEDEIISVAGSSVKTSREVAELAENLVTLGKTKTEIKDMLEPVNNLAIGLETTSGEAAEFLVQTLNAFGAGSDEAAAYADTIATIRTSTTLDFQKMRDSFQYLTPISRILNKDLAYTGSVLGILADNGLKAEAAGRLLGTAQQKLAKEGKSLLDALNEINEAQRNGIEGTELLAIASELFGAQAAKVGVIMANNTDNIEKNAQAIRDNGGALDDLVNQQLESLDSKVRILDSTWEKLILRIEKGDGVIGRTIAKSIAELTKNLELFSLVLSDDIGLIDKWTISTNHFTKGFSEIIPWMEKGNGLFQDSVDNILKDTKQRQESTAEINKQTLAFIEQYGSLGPLTDEQIRMNEATEDYLYLLRGRESEDASSPFGTVEYYQSLIKANNDIIRQKKTVNDLDEVRQLQKLNEEYQKQIDLILGNTNGIKKNTIAKKENKKATEDTFGFLKGTIPYYEEIISGLKTQQEELSRTSKEWYAYQEQIDDFTGRLEVLQRMLKGDYSLSEGTEKAGEMIDKLVSGFKRGQKIMEDLQKSTETFISSFSSDFISQNPFSELMKFADGSFDLLLEGADTTEEKFAVMFNGITEAAQQTFNVLSSLSQENFTQQYESLERQKEIALQFAGESVTAREEIKRQYEEKRKSIQRREAQAQKDLALFNIGINTAQAAVSAYASQLVPGDPTSITRAFIAAGIVTALGAAQAAVVASQTIPQFWEGGIVGGSQQIMVNDDPYGKKGANYKEVVRKPNGQTLFPQGKNVKMTVPKGTEIFPTYDAFMSTLNTELGLNGIGLSTIQPNVNVNGGITESQIRSVMAEHGKSVVNAINNKTEYHVNWDENGMNKYIVKGNTKREVLNARFRGRGRSV